MVLNLLFGWEIIHLSKRGKKVTIRLKEFPDKPTRFVRVTFSKCVVAEIIDYKTLQTDDFASFDFEGCLLYKAVHELKEIVSIHLLRDNDPVASIKIMADEISFDFTSR
jgi:hypothetical protein